jgi:hypothetical protein
VESFINTFLVLLFGSIAFGIVSGIFHDMAPTLPPGFHHSGPAEAESSVTHLNWHLSEQQRFVLVFAILFSVSAWTRLVRPTSGQATGVQKLGRRISTGWFCLIVGNAFGAMISAIVIAWVQKFSLSQLLFQWVWAAISAPIQLLMGRLLGDAPGVVQAWFSWYDANQLRFTFWFLYVTAICDDLGLPNLKTGARWLWRRWRNRVSGTREASGGAISAQPLGSPEARPVEPAPR